MTFEAFIQTVSNLRVTSRTVVKITYLEDNEEKELLCTLSFNQNGTVAVNNDRIGGNIVHKVGNGYQAGAPFGSLSLEEIVSIQTL